MVGNGDSLPFQHSGAGSLPNPTFHFQLKILLHVPQISSNLISVHQLTQDNNCTITFDKNSFVVQDKTSKAVLSRGFHSNGLYQFSTPPKAYVSQTISSTLWHKRLGHPSIAKFNTIAKSVPIVCNKDNNGLCSHCCVAKSHRLPFTLSSSVVNQPLALIHSDVWGPFTQDESQYSYYVLFIDDFSGFTWLFPLHYKSEVFTKFLEFKMFVEKQFSTSLKIFRSDGGGEYSTHKFNKFFTENGLVHQFSCPHTPSQNGLAERKHRHIIETAITLLHHSSLPLKFLFEAVSTAAYLINRLPRSQFPCLSPFQVLFGVQPDYDFLRVFGCCCYP